MITKEHKEFQERMRLVLAAFAQELPHRISEIESLWQKLRSEWDSKALQEMHRSVHHLVSNGKTFGYPELSVEARALEKILKSMLQVTTPVDDSQSSRILQQIDALKRISIEQESKQAQDAAATVHDENALLPNAQTSSLIYVVEADAEAAQELALQLRYYGYEVEVFNHLDKFRAAVQHRPDAIILMDVEFPEDEMGGILVMEQIQKELAQPARVIFISTHDAMAYRLGAVRAGGVAYFTKPINSTELIDQLDLITASQIQEPFRVLIVDDSQTILAYHATILEQAGMLVKTVGEPLKLLGALNDFNPDLILMDLYMPGCNGVELARVIRQIDGFLSTPIVYLSSENDFNTQAEAMSLCGDDFLVKPIGAGHLVSAVTTRATRARFLRSMMIHDGLTGLLNHTAIKEELAREVIRSSRLSSPLSLAMVDIDFFKKVNDTYGHAAGDRVLKSLARLLKQRLRETDIVGRYGGEEFAVIMNDTDAASAAKVIDEIRTVFSRLLHLSHDEEFSVNFSCGIADLAHFSDAVSLSEAADKALYQAKQRGRNKVIVNAGD
ncbi:diguanylate cyclase [Nitrosomonas sp. Is35]|uniref:diguanylate cyclase n=1 Tax=unclassified Nitrosomonas TaxID=2609265 RepID=UPI00294B2385|nr:MULTISPECIES: diguanylate cyclase [unclassified Nitrosomonas]MDV6342411.1 diguanylate cyclase [Nitrosomonas sp. Is24]MDV6348315.1 diguanylate cyclase [Nitrosomonas sp. Is35]